MSLELIHNKDTLSFMPIVCPVDDDTSYTAKVITHHRAPDVYEMLFGTTHLPRMRQQRHLKAVQ